MSFSCISIVCFDVCVCVCRQRGSYLVLLLSLRAVAMYSESLFSISATLIQARPYKRKTNKEVAEFIANASRRLCLCFDLTAFLPWPYTGLALARDVLMFSMHSMLLMQLLGTLAQATRT